MSLRATLDCRGSTASCKCPGGRGGASGSGGLGVRFPCRVRTGSSGVGVTGWRVAAGPGAWPGGSSAFAAGCGLVLLVWAAQGAGCRRASGSALAVIDHHRRLRIGSSNAGVTGAGHRRRPGLSECRLSPPGADRFAGPSASPVRGATPRGASRCKPSRRCGGRYPPVRCTASHRMAVQGGLTAETGYLLLTCCFYGSRGGDLCAVPPILASRVESSRVESSRVGSGRVTGWIARQGRRGLDVLSQGLGWAATARPQAISPASPLPHPGREAPGMARCR